MPEPGRGMWHLKRIADDPNDPNPPERETENAIQAGSHVQH